MFLFRKNRSVEHHEIMEICDSLEGWFTGKTFSLLLKQEVKRSYRTNGPLSYVIIEIKNNGLRDSQYRDFFHEIINIMHENTREYDIKCINNDHEIGILLVDTAMEGAKAFCDKVTAKLFEHFSALQNKIFIRQLDTISLTSYPLNKVAGTDKIFGQPVVIKNLEFQPDKKQRSGSAIIDEYSAIEMTWDLAPNFDGTMQVVLPWSLRDMGRLVREAHYDWAKRCIDVVGALTGLILFSPILLVTVLCIKLTSNGPVLFKQKRLGLGGKTFTFLKFRSMKVNNDERIHKDYVKKLIAGQNAEINNSEDDIPNYKIKDDPRITTVGYYLRKLSIDEMPQFFNVLAGQMSLVGPRPPIPYEVDAYKNWHLRRISEVKPGISGLWQVNGRSATTFDEMVRLDLQYVSQRSLWLDIRIILKTFLVVFNTKGAY